MRATAPSLALAALFTLLTLSACDKPDVGMPCDLAWNSTGTPPPPTPQTTQGDYFEMGNTACDGLVCIVSPVQSGRYSTCSGTSCGYCSKACVSDRDCYNGDTGLVCDSVVLDPAFVATLDDATRQRYLGDINATQYCVVPRT